MSTKSRATTLTAMGIILVVAGLVGAVLLWLASSRRADDAVQGLARAPVGCDTTLDFEDTGTFLVFIERVGTIPDTDGNCDASGDFSLDTTPRAEIQLVGPDGELVDVENRRGVSYDRGGSVGEAAFEVQIDREADFVLRVESDVDDTFAVAVGRDPFDGVALLQMGAIAAALGGLLLGIALLVSGRKAGRAASTPAAAPWPMAPPGGAGGPVWSGQPGPAAAHPPYVAPPPPPSGYPAPGTPYGAAPPPVGPDVTGAQPPAPYAGAPQTGAPVPGVPPPDQAAPGVPPGVAPHGQYPPATPPNAPPSVPAGVPPTPGSDAPPVADDPPTSWPPVPPPAGPAPTTGAPFVPGQPASPGIPGEPGWATAPVSPEDPGPASGWATGGAAEPSAAEGDDATPPEGMPRVEPTDPIQWFDELQSREGGETPPDPDAPRR